jgi:AraC-like DNA-binding protein
MSSSRQAQPPSRGAPSPRLRDNIYWFGSRGCIFTSPGFRAGETTRQAAVLLLTASRESVEVAALGSLVKHDALGIAPMCTRQLHAVDVGLVSVNVHVDHPAFRAFCTIPTPGLLSLERSAFSRFDDQLVDAYEGRLSREEAEQLFESLVQTATAQLPEPEPSDPRTTLLRQLVRRHPSCTLEDLADELNVSYTTASHLFSRTMGVSLRSYQLWIKAVRAAARMEVGARLTDIAHEVGFVDSAHLSRTWRRTYGFAPSYVTDGTRVRVLGPPAPRDRTPERSMAAGETEMAGRRRAPVT